MPETSDWQRAQDAFDTLKPVAKLVPGGHEALVVLADVLDNQRASIASLSAALGEARGEQRS